MTENNTTTTEHTEDATPASDDSTMVDLETTEDTGQDDTAARLAEVTAERDQLAAQLTRLQIAAETGVPAELLRGVTSDELRAHADALKAYAGQGYPSAPPPTPITPPPPSTDPLRDLLGRR